MYDRGLWSTMQRPERPMSDLRSRTETLLGVTGVRMAKYRSGWSDVTSIWFRLAWRPHLLGILLFEVCQLFRACEQGAEQLLIARRQCYSGSALD